MEILAGCNRRLIHQGGAALKRLGLPYLLFTGALLHEVPAVVGDFAAVDGFLAVRNFVAGMLLLPALPCLLEEEKNGKVVPLI
jgi:hypothetical protein